MTSVVFGQGEFCDLRRFPRLLFVPEEAINFVTSVVFAPSVQEMGSSIPAPSTQLNRCVLKVGA